MKLSSLLIIIILLGNTHLPAQNKKPYEETTWNAIRELLFNGNNTYAFRYEEDIRFQLVGEASHQDSVIILNIISEISELIETVDVKLVEKEGNFIITILDFESKLALDISEKYDKNKIIMTQIGFNPIYFATLEGLKRTLNYYIIGHLTKSFQSNKGRFIYGGIFDSNRVPEYATFSKIDRDLVRKLYSFDFYKQLKNNTIKTRGIFFYFNLRYRNAVKFLSYLIAILFTFFGLYYLLSKDKVNSFWNYFRRNIVVLIFISIVYTFYQFPNLVSFIPKRGIAFLFLSGFPEVFIYGSFALVLIYFSEYLILNKTDSFYRKQIIIFTITIISITASYFILSIPFTFMNIMNGSTSKYSDLLNATYLFYIVSIAVLRVFYNYLNYREQSLVNQKDVELAKMKELKNQAELNALHSRINPHFLYNSLNSIASLAHINPDKTENMATALSELFRYSINKEDKTFVGVDEELAMVEKYLEIEKTRFGDKLHYRIVADENVKGKQIPKFLIQPIAENAIKHGLSKIDGIGKITVEVKQVGIDLEIVIYDNGPDFPDEPISGYGLQNMHDKLEIIYGDNALTNWENGINKHFKITLKNQF